MVCLYVTLILLVSLALRTTHQPTRIVGQCSVRTLSAEAYSLGTFRGKDCHGVARTTACRLAEVSHAVGSRRSRARTGSVFAFVAETRGLEVEGHWRTQRTPAL